MTTLDTAASTASLWAAVDKLTKPTIQHVYRDEHADAVEAVCNGIKASDPAGNFVPRFLLDGFAGMTRKHGTIPSLWDQATDALTTGTENSEGRSRQVHRTPCDLDLMEIRALIRETTAHELNSRNLEPRETVPEQLRQLAAHVIGHEPDQLWWWEYRMAAWARLLATYLQAADTQPKPRRLRNAACPECNIRHATIEIEGENHTVPPLLIDFRDGYVRAAECSGCGAAWFRGDELVHLAQLIEDKDRTA